MVILHGEAPPPPRPWEDAPEIDYRLHKNRINMARSYDSTLSTMKRLILRESANESEGTQFVTDDDEDSVDSADGKFHIHKIPQLPLSKNKYFIVVMYPPEDLDSDDIPMDSAKPVKFLFSFYNLYLIGFSYDDIWHIFNDAMIVGISQESRDKYLKELAFAGDYNTIAQNYKKLDVGFYGQCDTHNKIVGIESKKTSEEQLIRVLCRTTVTLPESARFAFLAQFHTRNFHWGIFDVVLDMEVVAGEEYKNYSVHLTKWGTYSTASKKGKKSVKVRVLSTLGIKSFSGLLNFITIATNKKYDEENSLKEVEAAKAHSIGDDHADDNDGNEGQGNDDEDFEDNNKDVQDVQGNEKTWFYQAPVMPYVPHRIQILNLDKEADVAMRAIIEINRKTHLEEIGWMLLLQLAMLEACKYAKHLSVKYFVEGGAIAVRRLCKEDSSHIARSTGGTRVTTYADMEGEETFDPSFLGHAEEVVEERISDDVIIQVKGTKNTSAVSTIDFILDEIEPSLHNALCIVKRTLDSNMIAAGSGAVEAALSVSWENQSATLGSRELLPLAEFAKSLPKVHDDLTLGGPSELLGTVKATLVDCTSQPLCSPGMAANLHAKCAQDWYADSAQEDLAHHDGYLLGRFSVIS